MKGTVTKKPQFSKGTKKSSAYRRIVTGNVNGRSVAQSDEQMQAYQLKTVPGHEHTLIWINAATPIISSMSSDRSRLLQLCNGRRLLVG